MLYNSDAYAVVRFDLEPPPGSQAPAAGPTGFEIVDKLSRKEIFLSGVMAQSFQKGAETLSESDPTPEQWDDYIAGYTTLGQQPLVMH
jgi:hypothetical protein